MVHDIKTTSSGLAVMEALCLFDAAGSQHGVSRMDREAVNGGVRL